MKVLVQKTELGKCVICKQKVTNNDEIWFNKTSVIYEGKIICGVCLVNLNGASKEALNAFDTEENMDVKERMMSVYGVYVDPDTGKIVSKGIRKAKA